MSPRDLMLYARTRLQLVRALEDAQARGDRPTTERIDLQLRSHPYNRADVIAEAARLLRPQTAVETPPTVLDFVRGKATRSSNPQGGA